jgi:hypothetical protein
MVVVLSGLVPVLDMARIVARYRKDQHGFLTDRSTGVPNWTEAPVSAVGHVGRPLRQKLARLRPTHGRMNR